MVIAKTDQAHRALAAQFKYTMITRVYEALIWGCRKGTASSSWPSGAIRRAKKFSPAPPQSLRHGLPGGKAIWENCRTGAAFPRTGAPIGCGSTSPQIDHPILGDKTYGEQSHDGGRHPDTRVMLHARTLGFHIPRAGVS